MRPQRKSKTRAPRWRRVLFGVLILSSVLYAALIVTWTLRSPDTGSFSERIVQRGREHSLQSQDIARQQRSNTLAEVPNGSKPEASVDKLLRGTRQEPASKPKPKNVLSAAADLPSNSSQIRRLKCLGWRATAECSPNGDRQPDHDKECNSIVPDGTAGYCEVEDMDSQETFRVMKRSCDRGYKGTVFRCVDAPGFANFRAKAQLVVEKALAPGHLLPNTNNSNVSGHQGIVMVVYPKLVASAYATIRALREIHDCRLPIEIWLRPDEISKVPGALEPLKELARNEPSGEITFQAIRHAHAFFFNAKVYAIYHCKFDQILFLDADNVPVRDLSYLFRAPEFVDTGAIFWPDFWHPRQSIFGINETSLVWQLLDTPFVDMFEQESGQLLIDRKRHAAPLSLVAFYAFHLPDYFNQLKLAWGDKDLFRFAWLKLGAQFHMITTPPAVAGEVTGTSFCGMTMGQHDPHGEVVFLHRNQLKLTGESKVHNFDPSLKKVLAKAGRGTMFDIADEEYPDPAIWTHLVSFRKESSRSEYIIQKHAAMNKFTGMQRCFGGRELHQNPFFYTREFADLGFSGLETHLRYFAREAARLQQKKKLGIVN